MIVNNKEYVMEYWMLNNIIDCGEISNNKWQTCTGTTCRSRCDLNINITISQRELELMKEKEHSITLLEKQPNRFESLDYGKAQSVNKPPKKLNKYRMNDNIINYNGNKYNEFNSNNRKISYIWYIQSNKVQSYKI